MAQPSPIPLLFLVLVLVLAFPPPASPGDTLVLGYVSAKARKQIPRLLPMADYAAAGLAELGVSAAGVRLARDLEEMGELLRAGRVDWLVETPAGAARLMGEAGALPLLVWGKKGAWSYRTLIVARRDGPVARLADLRGRRIAFEDPGSTSGFYLPLMELEAAGLSAVPLAEPRAEAPRDAVGYAFAGSERNVVTWVLAELAAAGALSDGDWEDPDRVQPEQRAALRVIHRSAPVPRALVVAAAHLDPRRRARLAEHLAGAAADPAAAPALAAFFRSAGFRPLAEDERRWLGELERRWRTLGETVVR
ncbi:MAG: phosphate-binding protein [Porticoccaceae bacterium]|nr:MAG: phosphate-binding protein [Porticoccaceae bacterium]